ncbi:hypothetical protein L207DRAFT_640162 [Hyaloscypha variabilis F]|uniref:Uncharacterized protein n=1 Tax=Hyaloscypha variabilis (strain UAMH 11265 / GT02V1 / F) TaxID=1149755 RepID=A0A2J6R1H8_HYAVF|nr:hypothetical protein L207DRAFT_640162 [Hyaloscypha variabilis F]
MYPLPSHRQELSTAAHQPSPVGATMHAIEQSTSEDFCRAKKHASYHHITRSVPGMKSLLPLRLLSPTLPDINAWPSSTPNNRSTFGMNITSYDEDRGGISQVQLEEKLDAGLRAGSQRLKPHRDVPIYSEPGSPLLNRAYLTDEEVRSSCSTSESEEWFEVYDCLNMEHESSILGDESSTIKGPIEDEVEPDVKNVTNATKCHPSPIDRSSVMSFQCSGEAYELFSNEAAWLRSSLEYQCLGRPSKQPLRKSSMAYEQNVESWLSDTSSCGDDSEDLLSRATCLTPLKAHVIDVNVNRPSGLSIHVPPRSSSLAGTTVIHIPSENNRDSWLYSAYSPPATPSQPWTGVRTSSSKQSMFQRQFESCMPKRRLDLAMTSPPDSPTHGSSEAFSAAPAWQMPMYPELETDSCQSTDEQAGLSADTINDILISLENLTSHTPSRTLQPDTPCILAIRTQLAPPSQQANLSHTLLTSCFPHQLGLQPEPTLIRRKTTNFSKPRRNPSSATSKSCPVPRNLAQPTPSLPNLQPHQISQLPPIDTQPLHRIFPRSSKFMRTSLYAYVLAHIFVSSLSTTERTRFPKKRRDTPYWPTTDVPSKAAHVLGMAFNHTPNEDAEFNRRVEAVKERIQKAIASLIEETESDGYREGAGLGLMFIKSLEEVVRGCEMDAYRSF